MNLKTVRSLVLLVCLTLCAQIAGATQNTQSTPLPAGSTATNSSQVPVSRDVTFTAFGDWKGSELPIIVYIETGNSEAQPVGLVSMQKPVLHITAWPGFYHLTRPALPSGATVGVTADVAGTGTVAGTVGIDQTPGANGVVVISSALPPGAATAAKQDTMTNAFQAHCFVVGSTTGCRAAHYTSSMLGSGAPTYTASVTGYAPTGSQTDMMCVTGAASKIVTISTFQVSPRATSGTVVPFQWIKRSTLDTGGTPTTQTATPHDSSDSAATATVTTYGTAPSLGTAVGTVWSTSQSAATTTTGSAANSNLYQTVPDTTSFVKPIALRSATEALCVNEFGTSLPAGFAATLTVTWTEQAVP